MHSCIQKTCNHKPIMSYIKFDKTRLINLEYALSRELIRSNRSGAYSSTTITNSNTRKYHGLLVVPQPGIDDDLHVLLSALDESIIQHDAEFNLGLRKYPGGNWNPKGHKYIRDFESEPIPTVIYRVGGVVLKKESLFATNDDRILIRYTLLDAHSPTKLRFKPFLAFRSRHSLCKSNIFADTSYQPVKQGVSCKMYSGYSRLVMQFSREPQYVHVPHWYYNIEYIREQERGYDYSEDLFVPGYFEIPLNKGESIIFSAGIEETNPDRLQSLFNKEVKGRIPRNNFKNCLINSAQQFLVEKGCSNEVIAGFHWFGRYGRDTFIALPGLTLELNNPKMFRGVMKSMVKEMQGPLFPNTDYNGQKGYRSADTPLWFFWAVQQYVKYTSDWKGAWKMWGKAMETIIKGYTDGTPCNIKMNDLGLIEASETGVPHTWMDAVVEGKPVTPRTGMAIEVNALWYNALRFFSEIAEKNGDAAKQELFLEIAERVEQNFIPLFWNRQQRYLNDYVNGEYQDDSLRPNQIIAISLPYSLLNDEQAKMILDITRSVLLTSRGLRSLSPHHPDYIGEYTGDQALRDRALHQGTVWPWLLGHFAEAWLRIYGESGSALIDDLLYGFEETMKDDGIGTVSEVYDGNPPHKGGGAISQAWSVAELLRIFGMLERL